MVDLRFDEVINANLDSQNLLFEWVKARHFQVSLGHSTL